MRNTTKRTATVAASATLCLVVAGAIAPGAVAAEKVDGQVDISSTETVSVLMGPDGSVDSERVYEQLVLSGKGKVDVSNPVSTKGLRNLDGFGGWTVRDGAQRVKTDVNGEQKYRSVSDFDGKLPVSIDVKYTLDGKRVEPGDVVGKSGELEVRYEVRNITGTQQEVTYTDGEGNEQTTTTAVVIPLVGSMTMVLPPSFTEVRPDGANAAGDGRGGTQLSFTMTLFPPIGSDRATFGYTAKIENGVVPKAALSMLPVNPLENNSFKGGAASYKGGADKGVDLTAGAVTIDENLLKIRDGANDLVDGLIQLRDGANELNAGLAGKAAPGAAELAAGAGKLDDGAGKLNAGAKKLSAGTGDLDAGAGKLKDGAGKLNAGASDLQDGAGQLSGGLGDAKAGTPALQAGAKNIEGGLEKVDAGLETLNAQIGGGLANINTGSTTLIAALENQLIPGLTGAENALSGAQQLVASLDDAAPQKAGLKAAVDGAKGAVSAVKGGLSDQVLPGAKATRDGSAALKAGLNGQLDAGAPEGTIRNGVKTLKAGVTSALIPGIDKLAGGINQLSAGADKLSAGTGALKDGTSQLAAGTGDLKDGTGKLRAGAGTLADGTGTLSDGTGKLSTGAGTLSKGLGDAATGSGKLADGLETAAGKAPDLPEGAQKLSDQGTSQLVNVGNGTAMDFGLKYALIEAGSARAASTQPYGAPEGATELTAYKFELAGANGEGSANVERGIAIAVLAAGGLGLAALRRRGVMG